MLCQFMLENDKYLSPCLFMDEPDRVEKTLLPIDINKFKPKYAEQH